MNKLPKILLASAFLGLTGGGLFVYSGLYSIGADTPHWRPVEMFIEIFRDRAISAHARGITVPKNLDDPAMIELGAEHYDAMCRGCHLSPLQQDSEIRPGLYPQPPKLAQQGNDKPAEAFWVIKHGVKLTAMPAWGPTHDDEEIWAMVAFLRKLPTLSPAGYKTLVGSSGEEAHDHDSHDHGDDKSVSTH
jgi:hypothetical protein